MKLYHTSDQEIRKPDIHFGRKNADFGWGFYLTPDRAFTYRWARENAVVNEYELDEVGLDIHVFSRSTLNSCFSPVFAESDSTLPFFCVQVEMCKHLKTVFTKLVDLGRSAKIDSVTSCFPVTSLNSK